MGRGVGHVEQYKKGLLVVTVHGPDLCNSRAFPTSCQYCRASIFFFKCDHESKVFFDHLGPPWPLHGCYCGGSGGGATGGGLPSTGPSYWRALPVITIIRHGGRRHDLLPGLRTGADFIEPAFVRRVREGQNPNREILRIEPLGSQPVEVVGVVQDREQPDLAKRYNLPRNSLGYSQLVKQIGDADPTQLTVLVDELAADPAAIDFFSYTFLCPKRKMDKRFRRDAIIQVRLQPVDIIGIGKIWKATTVECLF